MKFPYFKYTSRDDENPIYENNKTVTELNQKRNRLEREMTPDIYPLGYRFGNLVSINVT